MTAYIPLIVIISFLLVVSVIAIIITEIMEYHKFDNFTLDDIMEYESFQKEWEDFE